jgi:tetratricopeptide (TPR) repeat protein
MGARQGKKPKPKSTTVEPEPAGPVAPISSRLAMEKTMRDIHKLLEEWEFQNVEEANAFLATLTGPGLEQALHHTAPSSPQEEAQELAWDAMEAATARQARKLAKQALAKDPDCVDALMALTQADARSVEEAIAGTQSAVAAGERSLGAAFFAENKGSFWGLLETRPYMRARYELADLLLEADRVGEAMAHFEALLELNPNDNQGVRYVLLACYLAEENLEGARRLLQDYKDDGDIVFAWGRVLESFFSDELGKAAKALKQARRQNHFVELYLTGELLPPKEVPGSYSLGSKEEAIYCITTLADTLARHPPAMLWLWNELGFIPPQGEIQEKLF